MSMKRLGLWAIGASALFASGWWAARIVPSQDGNWPMQKPAHPQFHNAPLANSGEGSKIDRSSVSPRARIPYELTIALQGDVPARTPALLNALEKMLSAEFTPDWAATIDKVLEAGDTEECQYVFSLLEQREDVASVNYLAKLLDHPQEEIRDRALMACEAVAGQVLSSVEHAKNWAISWQPDPEKQKLFSNHTTEEGTTNVSRPGKRPIRSEQPPIEIPEKE